VGRSGQRYFQTKFRKEYPEIKVVTVNGTAPAPFFILDGIAKAMENMAIIQLKLGFRGLIVLLP
jgi:hypothetical protein